MESRALADGQVSQCPDGHGVFLSRADLGSLIEAETDWHRNASQHTAPMPRITADMTAPPTGRAPGAGVGGDALQLIRRRPPAAPQMSRNVSMLAPSRLRRSARSS